MKITQTNNDQLEINERGTMSVIGGVVFVLAGIGTAIAPLIVKDAPWWVSLIGAGLILVGVLVVFGSKSKHIVLAKTGLSSVTETKVIGGKTDTISFDATRIASVGLETRTEYHQNSSTGTNNSAPQRERVSTLFLTLNDNSEVLLATSRGGANGMSINGINLSSFKTAPLSKEANQLSQFFGVPLSASNQGALGLADIGQIINGVKSGFQAAPAQSPTVQPVVPQPIQPAALPQQQSVVPENIPVPTQTPLSTPPSPIL